MFWPPIKPPAAAVCAETNLCEGIEKVVKMDKEENDENSAYWAGLLRGMQMEMWRVGEGLGLSQWKHHTYIPWSVEPSNFEAT